MHLPRLVALTSHHCHCCDCGFCCFGRRAHAPGNHSIPSWASHGYGPNSLIIASLSNVLVLSCADRVDIAQNQLCSRNGRKENLWTNFSQLFWGYGIEKQLGFHLDQELYRLVVLVSFFVEFIKCAIIITAQFSLYCIVASKLDLAVQS